MKRSGLICWAICLCAWAGLAQNEMANPTQSIENNAHQLRFIPNQNQWEQAIKFRASIPSGYLFLRKNSLQYTFYNAQQLRQLHQQGSIEKSQKNDSLSAYSFEVEFLNANPNPIFETKAPFNEKYNYFLGDEPQNWATHLTIFGEVWYKNVYPNIDLRLYEHNNTLKYEFIVYPNANPAVIQLKYKYVTKIQLDKNDLRIETPLGNLTEKQPHCYQNIQGKNTIIPSKFKLENQILSFDIKEYTPTETLVIDPELIFSTYSGARDDNWGFTATYDNNENLYLGGIMFGSRFPATFGAFQVGFAGVIDVVVMKFSDDGRTLIYSTFLGGSRTDVPHSLVVDSNEQLIIMGTTGSSNFPRANAFQNTFAGGAIDSEPISGIIFVSGTDLFITKLNVNGNALIGSTFLGGSADDGLTQRSLSTIHNYGDNFRGDVFTDNQGFIYVASITASTNFPVLNAFKNSITGTHDGILVKMSPNLSTMIWGTYYGGNNYDAIYNLKINALGDIYICGVTKSTNLPTQTDAFITTFRGVEDGFIARFNTNGNHIQTTYIGTSNADQTHFIDFDTDGDIYTFGITLGNYPVNNVIYSNANSKQFLHKIKADLSRSVLSTVIGSGRTTFDISPTAFLVNECGNLYLGGWGGNLNNPPLGNHAGSNTNGLPTTTDAFQRTTDGNDFYFMVLEKNANSLIYATFFGSNSANGDHVDGGTSRFSKKGIIYHAACASCGGSTTGFPTQNPWSSTNNSTNCNMAGFKFNLDELKADFKIFNNTKTQEVNTGCTPFSPIFEFIGSGARQLIWEFILNGRVVSTVNNRAEFVFTFTQAGIYTVRLTARNSASCIREIIVNKQVTVFPFAPEISPDITICAGASTQLNTKAEAGSTFVWTPEAGLNNPNIPNPIATPEQTTTYTVKITTTDNCEAELSVKITIDSLTKPAIQIIPTSECGKKTRLTLKNNVEADAYLWDMGNGDTFDTKEPPEYTYQIPGAYTVTLTLTLRGCSYTFTKQLEAEDNTLSIPNTITPNGDGKNDLFVIPYKDRKVNIFTRWGKLIYKSDNYDSSWGTEVAEGVYNYEAISPNGAICKGWIYVMK